MALVVIVVLAGCGGGSTHRAEDHLPPPPLSARDVTGGGGITVINAWRGRVSGQRLVVAVGRDRTGRSAIVVTQNGVPLRTIRAPRAEGTLRFVRRRGAALVLRSHRHRRLTLDLRSLRLDIPGGCPTGALRGPLFMFRVTEGNPLPPPRTHAFAGLLAIVNAVNAPIQSIDAKPEVRVPCGLGDRTVVAHVVARTPRPIVSVMRKIVFVSRFQHGWRAWRVQRDSSKTRH